MFRAENTGYKIILSKGSKKMWQTKGRNEDKKATYVCKSIFVQPLPETRSFLELGLKSFPSD